MQDDGSLAALNIPRDESNRRFNCPEITQQRLINLSFWIVDYIENVKTKFGEGRTIVLIKFNLNDNESDSKKFFTNSHDIKYTLSKVKELNMFPRKATMRATGNRYYLE
jgi:hypothetical protein